MSKQKARILIKYSASKCNNDLLVFIKKNIQNIKKKYNFNILIIYDENISLLKDKIKKLPVLIINNELISGNGNIIQKLTEKTNVKKIPVDIDNIWSDEMFKDKSSNDYDNNKDNDCLNEDEISRKTEEIKRHCKIEVPKAQNTVSNQQKEQVQLEIMEEMKGEDIYEQQLFDSIKELKETPF